MTSIAHSIPILFFLAIFAVISNAQQPSGLYCFTGCPQEDLFGIKLNGYMGPGYNHRIWCYYDPHGLCLYYTDGGFLSVSDDESPDHTNGCPEYTSGPKTCVPASEVGYMALLARQRTDAQAARPRASRPEFMAARSALGKKKRARSNVKM